MGTEYKHLGARSEERPPCLFTNQSVDLLKLLVRPWIILPLPQYAKPDSGFESLKNSSSDKKRKFKAEFSKMMPAKVGDPGQRYSVRYSSQYMPMLTPSIPVQFYILFIYIYIYIYIYIFTMQQ